MSDKISYSKNKNCPTGLADQAVYIGFIFLLAEYTYKFDNNISHASWGTFIC